MNESMTYGNYSILRFSQPSVTREIFFSGLTVHLDVSLWEAHADILGLTLSSGRPHGFWSQGLLPVLDICLWYMCSENIDLKESFSALALS